MAVPSNCARRLEANKVRDHTTHRALHADRAASRRKVKEACLRCICEGGNDMVMTGSMAKYTKGNLLLIDDRPIRYAMSNKIGRASCRERGSRWVSGESA